MWLFVASSLAAAWRADPAAPLPVLPADPAVGLVLLATEAPAEWGAPDHLVLTPRGDRAGGHLAIAGVTARALPADLAGWQGAELSVQTPAGSCAATISALMVVSRQSWMDGYAGWAADDGPCTHPGPTCDAEILRETLASTSERLLVGVVAGCPTEGGAVATRPGVLVGWAAAEPAASPLFTEAMDHLRDTAEWRAAQAAWEASEEHADAVTEDNPAPRWGEAPRVARLRLGGRTWVSATDEMGGCGSFWAATWAVWELETRKGRVVWRRVPVAEGLGAWDVQVVSGSGSMPTFQSDWRIVAPAAGRLGEVARFEEPWAGCGC